MENLEVIDQISELTGVTIKNFYSLRKKEEYDFTFIMDENNIITHLNLGGLLSMPLFDSNAVSQGGQSRKDFDKNELLEKISLLTNLVKLDLSYNNFYDITPIGFLPSLQMLDLSNNEISNIHFIRRLPSLIWFDISHNNISYFEEIKFSETLRFISLNNNKVEDIPQWFLKFLFPVDLQLEEHLLKKIKNTVVKSQKYDLAAEFRDREKELIAGVGRHLPFSQNVLNYIREFVILKGNPITSPPMKLLTQSRTDVLNYYNGVISSGGETKSLYELKLLIIGEGGTGKTSFMRKVQSYNAAMPSSRETTLGIDVTRWVYDTEMPKQGRMERCKFHVNIWDFGGQKIYQGTHQLFFSEQCLYVLVAETREQKTDFIYWLNTVKQLGGDNSSVVIIINKKYGHELKIDQNGYQDYFKGLIKEVIQLDLSKDKDAILDMQEKIKNEIKNIPGIKDEIPSPWLQIREDILKITANFISFDKFTEICVKHGVQEYEIIKTISRYFNRLGVFSHYIDDPILMDRIYLDSNWLVKTVYRVLDNEIVKKNKGRIDLSEIKIIWNSNEIKHEIPKLSQLMDKFGLMYHVKGTDEYVVPAHLPSAKPYVEWEYSKSENMLYFIYKFDNYMPRGLMSKVIVALNRYISEHNNVWHMGVNLSLHNSHAEIVESYGAENRFDIRIVGISKVELLALIRDKFADVLAPFTGLKHKQLVPCICEECIKSSKPSFHDYDRLLQFREKNKPSQCDTTGELIDVERLLKITEMPVVSVEQPKLALASVQGQIMKTIKIFLASSSELVEDRRAIREFISVENDKLHRLGVYIELVQWEYFLDAVSKERLQEEYNKSLIDCDIFLSLYFTKVGKFTAEEFEKAFGQFTQTGRPLIYTYFKNGPINYDEIIPTDFMSKLEFVKKLSELGHYKTIYTDINDLKVKFKYQLDLLIPKI